MYVEGQAEEAAEGEDQDQLLQPLPLGPLQVNLTAAAARLSGGRARAAASGGSGGLLSTAQKVGCVCVDWGVCVWGGVSCEAACCPLHRR